MELSPLTEAWTTTVPWARPWRRPAAQRRVRPAAQPRVARPAPAEADAELAWTVVIGELAAARLRLAELAAGDDPWAEAMAAHQLHLATSRMRALQARLGLHGEPVYWSVA
jgi:hypothetical protein